MAAGPEHPLAAASGFGAPVKPVVGQFELIPAVPEAWLDQREDLDDAEKIDRLSADADLILTLSLNGYSGPAWEYVATELARYGLAVIGGWMRRGMILDRCRERGSGGLPNLDRRFDPEEIVELAGETVAKALVHFRSDVLMKHRWNEAGGATLRTFFIGQCLLRFSNIYRRWFGNESRFRRSMPTDDPDTFELFTAGAPGVDGPAVDRTLAAAVLATVKDPRVQRAMLLTAGGRSQAEIAHLLGCTEKAVERMLYNERQRLRARKAG